MSASLRVSSIVVAMATVFAIQSAQAATVVETLRDFGLLGGSWATQCNVAASIDNNHRTYSAMSGDLVQEYNDLGPDYQPNIATITVAVRLAPNQLQATSTLQNGTVRTLIIVVQGKSIRTMSNIRADGSVLVKDGIVQLTAMPRPC